MFLLTFHRFCILIYYTTQDQFRQNMTVHQTIRTRGQCFFSYRLVHPEFDGIGRLWFNWPGNLKTFQIFKSSFDVFHTKKSIQASFFVDAAFTLQGMGN